MFINFRYHIFTITAIFAALGLGILIGSSIIGQEGLVEEQKKIINNIGKDIDKLMAENIDLKKINDQLEKKINYKEEVEKKILPFVINENIKNKNYCLFTPDKLEPVLKKEICNFFNEAGSNIIFCNNYLEIVENQNIDKLIIWSTKPNFDILLTEIKNNYNHTNIVTYQFSDVLGLVLTLLEAEIDEIGEEHLNYNSSL